MSYTRTVSESLYCVKEHNFYVFVFDMYNKAFGYLSLEFFGMKIETGKGEITLLALLGIWSVSAVTSLPGLAISPILGKLSDVFLHVSDLELQMLTSLPSLLIIPFVLIAGWLIEHVGYIKLLYIGLCMFLLCGVLYFLCSDMRQLIAVSAMLGIGAGIVVPLSTALIARFFCGKCRIKQFGYSSAINNMTLVIATSLAGYLAEVEWKLPFVVYLLPLFSLLAVPAISRADSSVPVCGSFMLQNKGLEEQRTNWFGIVLYMVYYFIITYLTVIVSFNLPFLLDEYGDKSGSSGVLMSLFFLSIMLPGFFISYILKLLKNGVEFIALVIIGAGLFIIYMYASLPVIALGCVLTGLGYGIAQPYIYDRVSLLATPQKNAFALALVMAMNYVAILLCPFIVDFVQNAVHVKSERFAFGLNVVITVFSLIAILLRHIIVMYKKIG